MIFYIEFDTDDVGSIVDLLCSLPGELCPTHFFGEDEPGVLISSISDILEEVDKIELGPILKNTQVSYLVGHNYRQVGKDKVKKETITCSGDLELDVMQVKILMKAFLKHNLTFGRACLWEELCEKNRVVVEQGVNTIESWVGRNLNKYIPGFY